ncbi:ureidoglycolate dehydrogenase [Exophiala viscosa]|uniref:Ureidoglycolate dehydrogenase n=1 Tax=Exophiala viscosa TaxID=2486360 RepID=A0AAN6I9W1_9EURO|nr:ureidoglycolate dehydrogenase [Exophiala viscosa]KAI1621063.1 ureidoglycolate dehydrogenase [Exophiala viscosa]
MKYLIPLACLATSILAAPTPAGTYEWTPTLAGYMDVVFRYIQEAKATGGAPTCDLSNAVLPVAPVPLPTPGANLTLEHVALGRGVQNYTCANSTATPAAVGAVARFYNASCVASDYPDLLTLLPNLALQYPLPSATDAPLEPSDLTLSTHHFFSNTTTPVFAFDAPTSPDLGRVFAQKINQTDAPVNAVAGVNGTGSGAVPWLYLTSRSDTVGDIKTVYRVATAGGNPPKTCSGQPEAFSVQYSALYWFYK